MRAIPRSNPGVGSDFVNSTCEVTNNYYCGEINESADGSTGFNEIALKISIAILLKGLEALIHGGCIVGC